MKKSQEDRILGILKSGRSINPLQALYKLGCFRLASRISSLKKQGYKISKMMVSENGKHYAKYFLAKEQRFS
jgi:hypothetical protein